MLETAWVSLVHCMRCIQKFSRGSTGLRFTCTCSLELGASQPEPYSVRANSGFFPFYLQAAYLLRNDGLFVGSSAAMNCVGAVKLARKLGPGHTIATILCDGGHRYA